MTLLDAPAYDVRRAKRNRNIVITIVTVIVAVGLFGVLGFVSGHGWFFRTVPAEHRVNKFFAALESSDYKKAFTIWTNDPNWEQHPDQYKPYDFNQFYKDWGPSGDYGTIKSHHIAISKAVGNGVVMGVDINGGKTPIFLRVDDKSKQVGFSPVELYVGP
jgi:hypothetical protein